MRKWITADFETDPFAKGRIDLSIFLAGIYDGKAWEIFWGEDAVKKFVTRIEKFDCDIYFHNGGKFDLHLLIPHLPKDFILPDKNMLIDGRLAVLKTKGPTFIDSYLLLPLALKKFGDKRKIDYALMESDVRDKNRTEITDYFIGDLVALHKVLCEFFKTYGKSLTLAGCSFRFGNELMSLSAPKTSEVYDTLFRQFYYGGRCEFWKRGKIPFRVKLFDRNSAYPAAMLENHPWGSEFSKEEKLPKRNLAQSFLRVTGESFGAFPKRTKDGLTFPHETGEFFVTGWEYIAALECGLFKFHKVVECYVPEQTRNFAKYVNYFYELKKKSKPDSYEYIFAKLMMNSFYGKLALNPRNHRETLWVSDIAKVRDKTWELEREFEDCDLYLFSRPIPEEKRRFYDVATAASITGHARAELMKLIHTSKNCVYCDSDSIVCEDNKSLKLGDDLGECKLEAEGEIWIAGKKLYALKKDNGEWKTASKGVRLSPSEIVRLSEGETLDYTFEAPSYSWHRNPVIMKRKIKMKV